MKKKNPQSFKHKLSPFSRPKFFSTFKALLTKQNLVFKKIIKAIEKDQKQDILQMENFFKPCINNLHVNGACLYQHAYGLLCYIGYL